jgi:hypothetical protein
MAGMNKRYGWVERQRNQGGWEGEMRERRRRFAYLLDNKGKNDTGIDEARLGYADDSIVDGALLRSVVTHGNE